MDRKTDQLIGQSQMDVASRISQSESNSFVTIESTPSAHVLEHIWMYVNTTPLYLLFNNNSIASSVTKHGMFYYITVNLLQILVLCSIIMPMVKTFSL